ncbi:hypothetical protein EBA29_03533 [Bacillus velezensis]|nr:hypothetical protein NG74_03511 [Bacillus velezensis]ATD74717.1 hypothetical protein CLI98_01412 [Bacillus velezensis]QAR58524.1 hypothetical protein EBA29_03533 [Bacillus velezensis]
MQDLSGENGFHLEQQNNMKVSNLVPVYVPDYSYSLRHELIDGAYDIVGTAESLEFIQGTNYINKVMQEKGFIELSICMITTILCIRGVNCPIYSLSIGD